MLAHPSSWTAYSPVSIAIGQEMTVTPLQLAAAFSAIANGGVLMKPYIVSKVMTSDGRVIKSFSPKAVGRTMSEETAIEKVTPMLAAVVARGTGKRARSPFYALAGKTGTAQKIKEGGGYSHSNFISSFCVFGPVEDPKVCVIIMVNDVAPGKPYYGGVVAAPAAGEIIERTLQYMGTPRTIAVSMGEPNAG